MMYSDSHGVAGSGRSPAERYIGLHYLFRLEVASFRHLLVCVCVCVCVCVE